jgi:ABC-2 type transport system permease protein
VITSMARLLRSRRGKDLAIFLIVPVGAALEFLFQVVPRAAASGGLTPASFAGVDSWLRWLPPGLAAHAIQDASTGHLGDALARLALLAVVIAVLGVLWVRSLARALVTADTTTGSSRVRNAALPLARYGLGGAVAARFLRYQHRDPASLANWAIAVVVMFICSASTIFGQQKHPGVVVASAVFGAAFAGAYRANTAGIIFGTLACVAVAVIPIIILGNVTSGVSAAIRLPVLFGCAAAYGFGLAWLGVRAAAVAAEGKLPELCQIAMRTSL